MSVAPTYPSFTEFASQFEAGGSQLVWRRLVADLDSAVSIFMKLALDLPYSFLLESVEDGDRRGRYSMIGIAPDLLFSVRGGVASITRAGVEKPLAASPPLEAMRSLLKEQFLDIPAELPPMAAGLFGYLSYDMVRQMETIGDTNPDPLNLPDCLLMRPTLIAVFDSLSNDIKLVVPVRARESERGAQDAYDAAIARLDAAQTALAGDVPSLPQSLQESLAPPQSNMSQAEYFGMVDRVRDYIQAGDVFQSVVSQRFSTPFDLHPFALYRALRRVNPSPYLFYLNFPDFALVGSSPEVQVKVTGCEVNLSPIAGTRPRGRDDAEDIRIGEELLGDEKERAEHLMLLDLGRNDVGRVSVPGKVEVTKSFALQKTSHLIHIVSDVYGELDKSYDVVDALVAGFPAGTVTGAPKIRAMEIVDELEPVRRASYAGCVGYFSANGDMDSCITLRTGLVKDAMLYVQAGGGVVHDSTPQYEYDETVNKAAALFRAAEEAIEQNRAEQNSPYKRKAS